MYEDGFSDVISIEYSEIVINKMKKAHKDCPQLNYEVMDVRDLKFETGTFDLIIDKGTLDAILCGSDSAKNAGQMLTECSRTLKKGGLLFIITYGQPQSRLNYIDKPKYNWKVHNEPLDKSRFLYTMVKQ